MSNEYKQFVKKEKRKNMLIRIIQFSIMILFILLWEILSNKNIINSFIFSSPSRIVKTIINLFINNNLLLHIYTTLYEVILSFIITSVLSLIISIIMYNNEMFQKIIEPYLLIINSLPKIALGPLLIIWIGANTKSIITVSILISLIVSIENIYISFSKTDKLKIKLLKTFNASKKDILLNVVIPENKNNIISSLKINISMCLIGVISGEFLTSKKGIGYLITYGTQIFNLDLVMSGIIILLILSFMIYLIMKLITNR